MLDILYGFVVKPIELLVELVFMLMYKVFNNQGIAICFVSLVIQLLVLPMYKKSDAMQDAERAKQKKMKHWVDHIKKNFSGDERFMMLQTYYRSEQYNQLSTIKGSLSLLLQIPFFIAAYNYLSSLSLLEGASFLFISDLSKPDGLLVFGGITLNLLPILMTLFNVISGIIYTKGFPLKDKIQTYGLAAIFLVLLYDSPAGLLLYWTLNNLFSLLKNVVMKILQPLLKKEKTVKTKKVWSKEQIKETNTIFTISSVVVTLLLGLIIPMSVIGASPLEFIAKNYSPLGLVIRTFAVFAGIIILWIRIFYMLSTDGGKRVFAYLMTVVAIISTVNFYFFGRNLGTMSTDFTFDEIPVFDMKSKLLSIGVVLLVAVFVYFVFKKKAIVIKRLCQAGVLTLAVMSVVNAKGILDKAPLFETRKEQSSYDKILTLSKNGQNVIVFMLDRAVGAYVPYIMQEKPELKEVYDGFTYYSNTMSYGMVTNVASPALFGGYEYTPTKINERNNQTLVSKQNEALTVMPKLFLDNGYNVTITDPPYAGYAWEPDLSIYDEYPEIKAYNTKGMYADSMNSTLGSAFEETQKHNLIYYSVMKAIPACVQKYVYDNGDYLIVKKETEVSIPDSFTNNYTVLTNLENITNLRDDDSNCFVMMQNETTHEPIVFQRPGYTPTTSIEGSIFGDLNQYTYNGEILHVDTDYKPSHYQTNVAALIRIGEWLEYLKKEGAYDNTRIIIVSDHGAGLNQLDSHIWEDYFNDGNMDAEGFCALLMYKDFNAKGFTYSDQFMTNADVPTLATSSVISNPVNPFTGNKITSEDKTNKEQIVSTSKNWETTDNDGYTLNTSDGHWYSVRDNIHDRNNWKKLD